jgi:hypothetical protein
MDINSPLQRFVFQIGEVPPSLLKLIREMFTVILFIVLLDGWMEREMWLIYWWDYLHTVSVVIGTHYMSDDPTPLPWTLDVAVFSLRPFLCRGEVSEEPSNDKSLRYGIECQGSYEPMVLHSLWSVGFPRLLDYQRLWLVTIRTLLDLAMAFYTPWLEERGAEKGRRLLMIS